MNQIKISKKLSYNQFKVLAMACTHGHLMQGCVLQSDYGGRKSTILSLKRRKLLDVMSNPTDLGRKVYSDGKFLK